MHPDRPTSQNPLADAFMRELRTPLTVGLGLVRQLRRRHAAGRSPETLGSDLTAIEAVLWRLTMAIKEAAAHQVRDAKSNERGRP